MKKYNSYLYLVRYCKQNYSIEDYNAFLTLTKLEYEAGLIKEQSPSELLRFTIRRLLNQLRNNRIYHLLEEQQQQQKHAANPQA